MARNLPQIPNPRSDIPKAIADILNPIREILNTRFLNTSSGEKAVTRDDLVALGLVTEDELDKLDN